MRLGYLIAKVDEVLGVQGELLANPVATPRAMFGRRGVHNRAFRQRGPIGRASSAYHAKVGDGRGYAGCRLKHITVANMRRRYMASYAKYIAVAHCHALRRADQVDMFLHDAILSHYHGAERRVQRGMRMNDSA